MSDFRVASRYAKSLLILAQEQGVLEAVHDDMQLFTEICKQNNDFRLMLGNPIINHAKKSAILKELFQGRFNAMTMAFFDIITRKNREGVLAAIAKEFHNQYNAYKSVGMAKISTVFPLSEELRAEFKSLIGKAIGMESIELEENVDADLIGGYVLQVAGKQIDDSLKSRLKELRLEFSHNPYLKGF